MSEFNKDAIALLNRITGNHIASKMRDVRNGRPKYERSWIWELIQNAKDEAAIDFPERQVSILIELKDTELKFSHNYGYFTSQNIEGLIRQINTGDKDREDVDKTNQPKATGRFGTGFMTTHLLSEKVKVSGFYKNGDETFSQVVFPLNRSGVEKSELINSVNDSFKNAEESLKQATKLVNVDFSKFSTSFSYHLDEKSKLTARTGLDDLAIALPYTLIFIDSIKEVILNQGINQTSYNKNKPIPFDKGLQLIVIDKITNGTVEKLYYILLVKNLTRIAMQVESVDGSFQLVGLNEKTPRLFLDFPLIGTETFYFPVVVNNPFFEPNEPRNGIFLEKEGVESLTNQDFFKETSELLVTLIDYAVESKWLNLYQLAKTKLPEKRDSFSQDWFKVNIQKGLRTHLLKSEIVQTETARILLKDAFFPHAATESKIDKIWGLAKVLHADKLPKLEHIHHWYKIIDSTWEKDLRYSLKKMVEEIAGYNNLTKLSERTKLPEKDTLIWLNSVVEFTVSENDKLLSDYAIIPNQYGAFRKEEELWMDDAIPEELKDVLKVLGKDWRLNLQHQSITTFQSTIEFDLDTIVHVINDNIKGNKILGATKTAVLYLLSCFPVSDDLPIERQQFWDFARDFYPDVPDKKSLAHWNSTVWEECDKRFMQIIISDIAKNTNTTNLTTYLKKESLPWLHSFINFVSKQQFETYLNQYAILPNQNGVFKKKEALFVDEDYNPDNSKPFEDLKDILALLGYDCRNDLLATEIALDIKGKAKTTKDIANDITDRVNLLLKEEGIKNRQKSTKNVFSKLLLWFHENEDNAKGYFINLYEKRHRLRSDDDIISDIKFRHSLLGNANGYSEEDILNFVNTPKNKRRMVSEEELEKIVEERIAEINGRNRKKEEDSISPKDLLVNLGIRNTEDLEKAKEKFAGTNIGDALQHVSSTRDFSYVHRIIERAKRNVKAFLGEQPKYDISGWHEESFTVIGGVYKETKPIKIVIRPADGGHIIVWYADEFDALGQTEIFTELWYDDNSEQAIYSLGKLLKKAGINRMPI